MEMETFWKSVKPFFSNKCLNSNSILLMGRNEIVNDDGKSATIMNMHFPNITKHMNLKANKISHREELVNILDTFKNHKNTQRIKLDNFHSYRTLNFSKVTERVVRKEKLNLSSKNLILLTPKFHSHRKQSIDLYCKQMG